MATRYGLETRMKAGEMLKQAITCLGPGGLGLQVAQRTLTSVRLEGGSSFLEMRVRVEKPTNVDLVLHQWAQHALSFMRKTTK